tara:strand:+ start:1270 stop:3159 length:1890 start_codon:yes stop_codon:yes gene_type:complete
MPIIPSVFQPIKQNDVQQRPFKAYKRYKLRSAAITDNGNGFFIHSGIFRHFTPHIFADTGKGVGDRIFPVNAFDNTNMHIVWNTIDHRYYRKFDPTSVFDYKDKNKQDRFLWYSASILTLPYHDVGESLKPGTFEVTSSIGDAQVRLHDDGNGNLIDPRIDHTRFASSSRNFFYMSFNDLYRQFDDGLLDLEETSIATYGKSINYVLNKVPKKAPVNGEIVIRPGISVSGSRSSGSIHDAIASGLSAQFPQIPVKGNAPYIRIPNDDKFDRFGRCDNWTISFWHKPGETLTGNPHAIMTKWGVKQQTYIDEKDKKRKVRDILNTTRATTTPDSVADFQSEKIRTNLHVVYRATNPSDVDANGSGQISYLFFQSDGIDAVEITGSTVKKYAPGANTMEWQHVAIKNESEVCKMYINGSSTNTISASLPAMCINEADILIGAINNRASNTYNGIGKNQEIAEIRFYDYAASDEEILNLANNNYLSASCYQTRTVGNVFHKNGQVVCSSPLPQYHTGSGVFGNTWNGTYRGTHMIYENEVLVRVPKDTFNVTMNPTANYRPATVGEICAPNHQNIPTGELRKPLFVSGTLKPYITTIGLYDESARMLAIGKLSTPVQKLDDVDMNFIVRWDY